MKLPSKLPAVRDFTDITRVRVVVYTGEMLAHSPLNKIKDLILPSDLIARVSSLEARVAKLESAVRLLNKEE